MYDVPGSGKHHRRPGGNGKHAAYHRPSLALSDKVWMAGVVGYLILMSQGSTLAQVILTLVAIGAVTWRVVHHPGDRHFNGATATPQELEEFERTTGEIPVIEPTAMSIVPPAAPHVSVAVQPPGRPSWLPPLLALAGAAFLMGLSKLSEHRLQEAREMECDLDALLGIPGRWNNYQSTVPAHGDQSWNTLGRPQYQDFLTRRSQAALQGYEQDRFSGANKEKWEQFFS